MFKQTTVLVTGGLGYIGSHTVVELQSEGFDVIILDDLSNSEEFILDRIKEISGIRPRFIQADLKCKKKIKTELSAISFTAVIHFAAYKSVGESVNEPLKYYKNNVGGMINLLEVLEEEKVSNFIFSSSCTVYGQADELPIVETTPLKEAESPYGTSKRQGEQILLDYSQKNEFKTIILRYFNPIGAHPSTLIGELPKGVPNNLIPYITQTAAGIRPLLNVFGDDYETKDGTAIRDYIYVVDLAKAHVLALKTLVEAKQKEAVNIYNLGSGTGSTVMEVLRSFEKVNKLKLNYQIVDRRKGDIEAAYADSSKAREDLGWTPTTSLEEALRTAWEWQKSLT